MMKIFRWFQVLLLVALLPACNTDSKNDEMSRAIAKPIEKAGGVEQELLDAEAKRRKDMEAQGI